MTQSVFFSLILRQSCKRGWGNLECLEKPHIFSKQIDKLSHSRWWEVLLSLTKGLSTHFILLHIFSLLPPTVVSNKNLLIFSYSWLILWKIIFKEKRVSHYILSSVPYCYLLLILTCTCNLSHRLGSMVLNLTKIKTCWWKLCNYVSYRKIIT